MVALLSTALFAVGQAVSAQELANVPLVSKVRPEDPPDGPPPEEGAEIQTRGPIHEAYAQPVDTNPRPGPVVPKAPPDPIPETPPETRPDGDNVLWIPGYWGWDQERKDYLWVSGFWRIPPGGRKWVPGHWSTVEDGVQWTCGFWAPDTQTEAQYLPEPPPSQENGPSVPEPNENCFYVPGSWLYQNSNYTWQPGYWAEPQPGYVWTPSYYSQTPSGYLYVSGYWDYPLAGRGLLFSPVYFNRPLWRTPGWSWRPNYWVGANALTASLWVGAPWRHYYFGNYYGRGYANWGFRPWFNYGRGGYGDPLFNYYRWQNRTNPGWYNNLVATHDNRMSGRWVGPPKTFAEQNRRVRAQNATNVAVNRNNPVIANKNNSVTVNKNNINNSIHDTHVSRSLTSVHNNMKVTRLNQTQINNAKNLSQNFHQAALHRQNLERRTPGSPGKPGVGKPTGGSGVKPKTYNFQHVPRQQGHSPAAFHSAPRPAGGHGGGGKKK
jgi:hypothetical protein